MLVLTPFFFIVSSQIVPSSEFQGKMSHLHFAARLAVKLWWDLPWPGWLCQRLRLWNSMISTSSRTRLLAFLVLSNSSQLFQANACKEDMLLQERLAEFKISSSGKLQGFLIWVEAAFSRSEPVFFRSNGISPVVLKQSQQPTESWIQLNSLKCCITVLSDVWFESTRSFHLVIRVTACHSPALWRGYNHPIHCVFF